MARFPFGGQSADYAIVADTEDNLLHFQANAALTVWDSKTGGTQLVDLATNATGDALTALTSTTRGEVPEFYGPDDDRKKVWIDGGIGERKLFITSSLPDLIDLKLNRDELPTDVAAIQAKLVAFERTLGTAISVIDFDETSNTWPIVQLPAGPVIWDSNGTGAAPPTQARGGYDYWQGFITGPTNVPDPTPTPDPVDPTPDPQGITLHAPVISGTGSTYTVTAQVEAGADAHTFSYLQIAVRGPGGQNADTGHRPNYTLAANGSATLTGTFTAGAAGTWRAYATYNLTGGVAQTDWVDGPATEISVVLPTPDPGTNTFPKANRSGLLWNSGMFVSGQWEVSNVNAAGTYRGTPNDTMLVFGTRNSGWGGAGNSFGLLSWYDGWTSWPGIFILSIPPQPEGQNNSATAAGTNNSRWRDFGSLITSKGFNSPRMVIRLGWECNGNWYNWSWHQNGGPASYIAAFKNVVDSVHQTAPNVSFDICLNKDWEHPAMPWRTVLDQLAGHLNVVGLDAYDSWDGWRNSTTRMNAWYNKSGPQRNSVAEWCRANGKLMSLDEWALCAQASQSGTGGGDDSLYITGTWDWLVANKDVIAWESYYHEQGAPSDQQHQLFNYSTAEAAYKNNSRWGGGF